ncbi:hypothetical protein THRCLA_22720 [Thraustotheca clavata]|uniref:Uncharacterized protein n=1 Tax=Thraustotheca clavata TaxID=74557 RepID=A0A1V9YU82_9STRA|nr:hypothetical protein THRCLA_22720 [Thraustotheca clavata]
MGVAIFTCSLTLSMLAFAIYLKILNNAVVRPAKRHLLGQYYDSAVLGIKKSYVEELLDALKCASFIESEQPEISPAEAIERMREVSVKMSDLQ